MTDKQRTVGDVIEELETLERLMAVYEDVVLFLKQFISTDTQSPTKGIKSPIGGEDVIPETVVEMVIEDQGDRIKEISEEIDKLRGRTTQKGKKRKKRRDSD